MYDMKMVRAYYKDCTLGRATAYDLDFWTLELPNLSNQVNISCIPEGTYKVIKRNSPTNGMCFQLANVPGRTYIQIHAANFTRQIMGCIAVGDGVKFLDSDSIPDVVNSGATLDKLLDLLPNEFTLLIEGPMPC